MTTRELRSMLYEIENQEMTIKELREKLFRVEYQDEEINARELAAQMKNN